MPRQVDPGKRRRQIAEALWRVIARDGLEQATVRAVAAEASLSLGALTPFFASQEALHLYAMQLVVARASARVRASQWHGAAREVAERVVAETLPLTEETRLEAAVYYAFLARARVSPAFREVADAVDADLSGLYRRLVTLLRNDGAVHPEHDTDLLAAELQALAEGLAFQLTTWPHRYSSVEARQVVVRWLDALGAAPHGAASARMR